MPGNLTDDEQAFKKRWSRTYQAQDAGLADTMTLADSVPTSLIIIGRRSCAYEPSFNSTASTLACGQDLFEMN
jgi:hypothetical protein